MNRDETLRLQKILNDRGFGPLPIDGVYGPRTAKAYERYLRFSDAGGVGTTMPVPPAAQPWWTNRALLGAVATIAASLAGLAGWAVDSGSLTDVLVSLTTVVTGIVALVGTIQHKAPIDRDLVLPDVRLRNQSVPTDAAPPDEHAGPDGPFFHQ